MKRCYQIKVYGDVQGVGFRRASANKAIELGLNGTVENRPDSSVLIEVEGESRPLNEFITWCQSGPQHANVAELNYNEVPLRNFRSFKVTT